MPISVVNDEAGTIFDNGSRIRAAPKYSITRGEDDALQWDPPIRSRELANALSYHYPLEQSLQEKMQHAILDFLDSEILNGNTTQKDVETELEPPVTVQSQELVRVTDKAGLLIPKSAEKATLTPRNTQGPEVFGVWDIKTGESVKPKGRKRGLSPTTRRRVAENRGNTCAYHQKAKTQCDPIQCRGNKLYPGTSGAFIESKSPKEAAQKKRGRRDGPSGEESHIPDWIFVGEKSSEGHPLKRVKAISTLSTNSPKSVKQLEHAQTPLKYQDCYKSSSKPGFEEETAQISLDPFANTNGCLGDAFSPRSQQISEGSKLFLSFNDIDISLDIDPTTAGQFLIENNMLLPKDWPSAEETFEAHNFDWIKDLMESDLPSLEYDWPREEAGATATLTDISSSPNTLFDFNYAFPGVDNLLGDSQDYQISTDQVIEDATFKQSASCAPSSVDELPNELESYDVQWTKSFVPRSAWASAGGGQANTSQQENEEYRHATQTLPPPPHADYFTQFTNSSLEVPNVAAVNPFNETMTPSKQEPLPSFRSNRAHSLSYAPLWESPKPLESSPELEAKSRGQLLCGAIASQLRPLSALPQLDNRDTDIHQPPPHLQPTSGHLRYRSQIANSSQDKLQSSPSIYYHHWQPPQAPSHPITRHDKTDPCEVSQVTGTCLPQSTPELELDSDWYAYSPGFMESRRLLPTPKEEPLRADTERHEGKDLEETRQEDLPIEQGSVGAEKSRTSFGRVIAPDTEKALISIDDLTTLLQNSNLSLIEPTQQVYSPEDEQPLVDLIILDDASSTVTPVLTQDLLQEVLRTSRSRVRLIHSICRVKMENPFKETPTERSSANTRSAAPEAGSPTKYMVYEPANTPSSRDLLVEYVTSISDNISATPDPNEERLVTLIYHSTPTGTIVKRAMVKLVEISMLESKSASYSLRWLDPDWRTIEYMTADLEITKNLEPCGLDSTRNFRRKMKKNAPRSRQAAHLGSVATLQSVSDGYEAPVGIDKAIERCRRRPRNNIVVLFDKSVDAVQALWKKMSKMKL